MNPGKFIIASLLMQLMIAGIFNIATAGEEALLTNSIAENINDKIDNDIDDISDNSDITTAASGATLEGTELPSLDPISAVVNLGKYIMVILRFLTSTIEYFLLMGVYLTFSGVPIAGLAGVIVIIWQLLVAFHAWRFIIGDRMEGE